MISRYQQKEMPLIVWEVEEELLLMIDHHKIIDLAEEEENSFSRI